MADPGTADRRADEDPRRDARELARRNVAAAGKPLSPVMKTAVTACELAHRSRPDAARSKG